MALRCSFGLGPAQSREEKPDHQALTDEPQTQAWLEALQVINRISTNALKNLYGVAGENITAMCGLYMSGTWTFFCRKNCEAGNILIKTKELLAQTKRYKTEQFKEITSGFFSLYVSISELTQSDSGLYRCGLGYSSKSAIYQDFRLFVADALLDGTKDHHVFKEPGSSLTVACSSGSSGKTKSFCRGRCGEQGEVLLQTDGGGAERGRYIIEFINSVLYASITQLTQSDSGWYRCKPDRSSCTDFHVTVRTAFDPSVSSPPSSSSSSSGSSRPSASPQPTDMSVLTQKNTTTSKAALLQFVPLTLIIFTILLSVALLVCCRKISEHQEAKTPATESIRMNENVGEEDEQWISAEVEIYTAYRGTPNQQKQKPTKAAEL
ncbi:uncharacterized protein LOC119798397 [Cyprinodon tularosa]|uniref:uncharacterized protein LOC119798397 n=1 Tax=Cyprinodon tularosa TaxID=77115 RepID=UPI0018E21274|nr:uncharacterized protein LOC119798397 [Cyprinodon tularosa]